MQSAFYRRGALLALVLSTLAANYISPRWDSKETITYNVLVLFVLPLIFPSPLSIMDKPLNEQVEFWAAFTKNREESNTEKNAKKFGQAYFDASFGKHQTRVVNLSVPSSSTDGSSHSIPVMCTCPQSASTHDTLPIVFYFFGGGLIRGSIEGEKVLERWLAQESNSVVCAIGYRLAPEYPYPAGVNDAVDASVAILERKVDVATMLDTGIDMERIGTWGASAGGYMAALTSRQLTERGYNLKCQVSQIPMVKPFGGTLSLLKNWNDVWCGLSNTYAWTTYLKGDDGTLVADWRVNLLIDPPSDVIKRLPPTYIEIHSRDVLRDEGELYAKKLEEQGKLIELKEYDVSHVGSLPLLANGGSADGADVKAASILKEYLYN